MRNSIFVILASFSCLLSPILSVAETSSSLSIDSAKPVLSGQRSIFMNGVDISSARNQDLRNIHLRIDEHGNVFITAPHYQVTEEETFTPLSSVKHYDQQIKHQPPQERANVANGSGSAIPSSGSALNQAPNDRVGDNAIVSPTPVGTGKTQNDSPVKTVLPEKPASSGSPR